MRLVLVNHAALTGRAGKYSKFGGKLTSLSRFCQNCDLPPSSTRVSNIYSGLLIGGQVNQADRDR